MPEANDKGSEQVGFDLIMAADSTKPYKTEEAATSQMVKKKLDGEVVPYKGGWAIKVADKAPETEQPKPEKPTPPPVNLAGATVSAAQAEEGQQLFVLCPKCGHLSDKHEMGDPCSQRNRVSGKMCSAFYGTDPGEYIEKFYWVVFENKSHDHEPDDVMLSVNGDILTAQRGEKVCIPGRYRQAAQHGLRPKHKKDPSGDRKIYAPVMTFPFSDIRDGTKEEYRTQVEEGNKKTRADLDGGVTSVS